MLKAGIDFGLTHVKAHWISPSGERNFLSTMDGFDRRGLANELRHRYAIDVICAAGNGPTDGFDWFPQHRPQGNPISAEIRVQAEGAARLLQDQRLPVAPRFMAVSIGTGVSYALRDEDGGCVALLGSAIGAGTVDGLLTSMGIASGPGIDALLESDAAPPTFDLMLGDVVPALKGTPYEAFVASHFAKAASNPPLLDDEWRRRFAASAVNMLVVDVARSLLLHDKNPDCRMTLDGFVLPVRDVVVVGTMPSRSRTVRRALEAALRLIGKEPVFPERAEYALAVGAYHAIEP
ncbi:MAG: hypothetical protein AAB554_04565 [Patescibacteria group bacterium]